jgi:preprotein translocase subunit SecG
MLHWILTILQFVCAIMIILLVLVQRGKGAEAGAGFGAGASGTVFGARGAGTALSRATAIVAAVFMLNSLALGYVGSHTVASSARKTFLDTAASKTPPAPLRGLPGTSVPPAGAPAAPAPAPAPSSAPAGTGAPGAANAPSTTQTPATTQTPSPAAPAGNAPKQ